MLHLVLNRAYPHGEGAHFPNSPTWHRIALCWMELNFKEWVGVFAFPLVRSIETTANVSLL